MKKKKKKNGVEVLEQEGMAHGESEEHRERVEGGAEARGRAEEVGGAPQADSGGEGARRVPSTPGTGRPRPVRFPSLLELGLGFCFALNSIQFDSILFDLSFNSSILLIP